MRNTDRHSQPAVKAAPHRENRKSTDDAASEQGIQSKPGMPTANELSGSAMSNNSISPSDEHAVNGDVTERLLREKELQETVSRLKAIVEDQPDPLCRFTPDGSITFANEAFDSCFGKMHDELINKPFFLFITHEEVGQLSRHMSLATPEQPIFRFEQKVGPGSDAQWREWTVRAIFDRRGGVEEFQAVGRDITSRKRVEVALQKSEMRYSNLIKSIPDAIIAYDPQGKSTYVNDGFTQLYGWTAEEVLGKSIDFVPAEEKDRTLAAWKNTFDGERVLFETKRLDKNGKVLDIQLRTSTLRDQDGNITESIVIHRDITLRKRAEEELQKAHDELEQRVGKRTAELAAINEQLRWEILERKNAEEKLRESESRYRMLVENAPLGIISCDLEGRIVHVNSYLVSTIGSPSATVTKKINLLTYPPLLESGLAAEIKRCMDTQSARVFECPYSSKWGKSAWLRLHMVPTKDAFGAVNGVQAVVEDITFRKQAETALSESEERFRAVFETAQDCIFLKDRSLTYTHVNRAFLRALDLPESQVIGKSDEHIFGFQETNYVKDLEIRVLGGLVTEATYNLTTHDVPKTFHCVRVPLRDALGETMGICGIARDITDRKAVERRCPRSFGEYRSAIMESALEQIRLAAQSESIVLLLGESGSGKDFLAKYLHDHSRRVGGPYFAINCAALPTSLAESELFGHEPGSFTGSRRRKLGLLELAEGGTLLLNEIGELSLELQAKLLTFLDTQSFTRVGGAKTVTVNARIVAATNRDLEFEVSQGRFREDLYYRLNVFRIRVPSLRERKEDISLLAQEILENLSVKMGRHQSPTLDSSALQSLSEYQWPGNVRELRNVLERSLILCIGNVIVSENLGISKKEEDRDSCASSQDSPVDFSGPLKFNDTLESVKRKLILDALTRTSGCVSAAARTLGLSRDALRHHIKALGIDR